MIEAKTVGDVFAAIQEAKNGATEFVTNFFPVQKRLEEWIARRELQIDIQAGVALVYRAERGFRHLYYSAPSTERLFEVLANAEVNAMATVLDVVGKETGMESLLTRWESAGFRRYTKLFRMARIATEVDSGAKAEVVFAEAGDIQKLMALLEKNFDPFGEQIPLPYELEAAIAQQQVLISRQGSEVGGLLFFETQGVSSTLRFWTVDERFRSLRLGSALMRRYFATQNKVKRFALWVAVDNRNAVEKYEHYGYKPDGLVDYVLANRLIRS